MAQIVAQGREVVLPPVGSHTPKDLVPVDVELLERERLEHVEQPDVAVAGEKLTS